MNAQSLKLLTMAMLVAWAGTASAGTLPLTVYDSISQQVSGGPSDYDISHHISTISLDNSFSRGTSDSASAAYRITGQASTDSTFLSIDDSARLTGYTNFQFALPTYASDIALWDISAQVRYEGWVGVQTTLLPDATASTAPLSISSSGPATGISFTVLPSTVSAPSGGTAAFHFDQTASGGVSNVEQGGWGIVQVALNVLSTSGGDESYAGFGETSGLSNYNLGNQLNASEPFSDDGIFVTLTFTPHLHFSGQTLKGAIALGSSDTVTGYGAIVGQLTGTGTITPSAAFTLGQSGLSGAVNYGGTLNVGSTSVTLLGQDAARLSGTTNIAGGNLITGNGVKVDGTLNGRGSVQGPVSGGGTVTATGTLTLGSASRADGFEYSGTLNVGNSLVTLLDSNQAILGSDTTLGGGALVATHGLLLGLGRSLSGDGAITGNLTNEGLLSPTNAGTVDLSISGDYTQTGNGILLIDIGSVTPGLSDLVQVAGGATLAGTLQVNFSGGFVLTPGDEYTFMSATNGISGEFDFLNILGYDASDFRVVYGPDSVSLAAVPEPASVVMMSLGLALVGFMAKRKRDAGMPRDA